MGGGGEYHAALVEFMAGTAGGIASVLAGHPFDTIKTRLQAQWAWRRAPPLATTHAHPIAESPGAAAIPLISRDVAPRYTGALHALASMVKEERVGALFRGALSPMLGVAAMNASIFFLYDTTLGILQGTLGSKRHEPTLIQAWWAGIASGVGSAVFTTPIEHFKIQQQVNRATLQRPAYREVIQRLWQCGGIRALYRGFGATLIRDTGYGPYFLSYTLLNRSMLSLHAHHQPLRAWELGVSGAAAGVVAWLVTYWADVVKTQLQAAPPGAPRRTFSQVLVQTYRDGGPQALFAGAGTTVLRAIPANAALFIVYEAVKRELS
ncbi:hypothetical protein MSPP1_001554 [Malassezia sp. CBS 17886]|nr:hypothetical protein MSPP1_001554 [Malassezia sp. CBS 17886]